MAPRPGWGRTGYCCSRRRVSAKGTLVRNGVKEKASGRGVLAGPRAGRPAQCHLAHVPPLETEHQARRESTQHGTPVR